jgi:flagellar hook-associated protein 1
MGLMNSALQIGRSALLTYQGALQTVGSNISSAAAPDYTRLNPMLGPIQGGLSGTDLEPGAGVAITEIKRMLDDALEGRLRLAIGGQTESDARQVSLAQLESLFDDVSGAGVGSRLTDFFGLFEELQNSPEDLAARDLTLAGGALLAESLQNLRGQLLGFGQAIDSQISDLVSSANELARQIGVLNQEITTGEAGRRSEATALRDQRDALLRDLSEIFDVTVREDPDGDVNVYIGSEALVQGATVRELQAVQDVDGEFIRTTARFADTNQQVQVDGGRMAGLIAARDQDAYGRTGEIDTLATAIIADVNRIHADGQGLEGFTSLTGSYDVLATDAALDSSAAGLAFPPQSGSFFITVADDATGTPVSYRINVALDGTADDTTLESLVEDINTNVSGATASITSDNRLQIVGDTGFSFTFGYDGQQARSDTSGVLAALGVNNFFQGKDASSIAVSETLVANPELLAAASVFVSGDGANAASIAALNAASSESLRGGTSIQDYFNSLSGRVAVDGSAANANMDAASSVLSALQAQKESVSGVNLDEEAVSLLKFQRAFQGVTRYVSVVDELLGELIALVR